MSAWLVGCVLWTPVPKHLKLTLVAIADACNDEGYGFPGQDRLAHQVGVRVRQLRNQTRELEQLGYLVIELRYGSGKKGRRSNAYQLNLERLEDPPRPGRTNDQASTSTARQSTEQGSEPAADSTPTQTVVTGSLVPVKDPFSGSGVPVKEPFTGSGVPVKEPFTGSGLPVKEAGKVIYRQSGVDLPAIAVAGEPSVEPSVRRIEAEPVINNSPRARVGCSREQIAALLSEFYDPVQVFNASAMTRQWARLGVADEDVREVYGAVLERAKQQGRAPPGSPKYLAGPMADFLRAQQETSDESNHRVSGRRSEGRRQTSTSRFLDLLEGRRGDA